MPAGSSSRTHETVLARADSAALSARRAGLGEAGRIRVAVGYCMDHVDVSKAVSVFNQRHAAIRVELQTMAVPLQFAALRDDRLDVGFVRPPVTDPSLKYEVLSREPMIVAMRSNIRSRARRGYHFRISPTSRSCCRYRRPSRSITT